MKKITIFFLLFFWSACRSSTENTAATFHHIQQLNQRMEEIYDAGHPEKLANFYTTDAIIFGPNDQLNGRSAIQNYWQRIASPVSLSLEILDLNTYLDSMIFIQKNTNAKAEIPPEYLAEISSETNHVFQLTKTILTYEREDVTFFRGETISLINWEEQPEEKVYRIKAVWLMDRMR